MLRSCPILCRFEPAFAAGMSAAYGFDLSGDDGGAHHIVIKDGKGEAGPGGQGILRD